MDATDLAALGAGAGLAPKVLGPTADYLGQRLLDGTKGVENFLRVLVRAEHKLGARAQEPGRVPPRVLRSVLDEALFCEDPVAAEYLSGILAASRGASGDDRGVSVSATISRLSSLAIRTHFVLYRGLYQAIFTQRWPNLGGHPWVPTFQVSDYVTAMEFESSRKADAIRHAATVTAHAFAALAREDLVVRTRLPSSGERVVAFKPTTLGAELFAFAMGANETSLEDLPGDLVFASELPSLSLEFVDPREVESREAKELTKEITRALDEEVEIKRWAQETGRETTYDGHLLSAELRLAYLTREDT